jgi:hypothetical protein
VRQGRSRKRFKAGYINCLGDVVIAANFQQAYPFRNGLASVQKEGRWGAINAGGELVIPAAYGSPLVFTEGLAEFSFDNHTAGNRRGVISLSGEISSGPATKASAISAVGWHAFLQVTSTATLIAMGTRETEKDLLYVDRKGSPVWKDGWVEFGSFDPLHLLPSQV